MRLLQSESAKKMHEAIPVYEREEASVIHEENIPKNRESNLMLESLQSKSTVLWSFNLLLNISDRFHEVGRINSLSDTTSELCTIYFHVAKTCSARLHYLFNANDRSDRKSVRPTRLNATPTSHTGQGSRSRRRWGTHRRCVRR